MMNHTYFDGTNVHSVEMMIAYINIFKPQHKQISISALADNLKFECWSVNDKPVSPDYVLHNAELCKQEYNRIVNADTNYPIIIHFAVRADTLQIFPFIVDGMHRLCKAKLSGKSSIEAYCFDKELMDKFIVDEDSRANLIELFYKRFVQQPEGKK